MTDQRFTDQLIDRCFRGGIYYPTILHHGNNADRRRCAEGASMSGFEADAFIDVKVTESSCGYCVKPFP